jgi:hypothetical protein
MAATLAEIALRCREPPIRTRAKKVMARRSPPAGTRTLTAAQNIDASAHRARHVDGIAELGEQSARPLPDRRRK